MLFLAKGIFSILLLSGAIWLLDWEALKTAFQRLGLLPFIVVIVLTTLTHIILGLRWNLLIRKIAVLPAYQHVRQYLLANFFNSFTPAEIGGDVYRYVALRKTADTSRQLITVLIKERAIGAMIYGAIYIVCLILFYLQSPDIFDGEGFVLFGIGAVILFGLIAFYPSIYLLKWVENKIPSRNDKIKKIISMSQEVFILGDLKTIFAIILLSVVSAVLWIVSVKIVAIDLGSPVSIFALAVLAIVVDFIRFVPVTVQGIGLREGTFAYFFGVLGHSPEIGFAIGLFSFLALSISLILAGGIANLMGALPKKIPNS